LINALAISLLIQQLRKITLEVSKSNTLTFILLYKENKFNQTGK